MSRARLLLATLAAYLPAAALPAIAERDDLPGAPLDPAVLVVPFCLGFALGFPAWGRAADRLGPERVIRIALLLAAGAGVLVAGAPTPGMLPAAGGLRGLAAAGVPPAVQAALAQDAPAGRTGRALSGMMLAVAAATLAGPALAPLLADAAGWTGAALLLSVPLPLLLALGGRWSLTGTKGRPRVAAAYEHARGVRAGWLVSALVLGGHWTVLTRLTEAVGPGAAS